MQSLVDHRVIGTAASSPERVKLPFKVVLNPVSVLPAHRQYAAARALMRTKQRESEAVILSIQDSSMHRAYDSGSWAQDKGRRI